MSNAVLKPHWSGNTAAVPVAVLGSLALGAGGRLAKNMLDLFKRDPIESEISTGEPVDAVFDQDVPVTVEQARRLQSSGVGVKIAAGPAEPAPKVIPTKTSPLGAIGYGSLAGAGAIAGWQGTDAVINYFRKRSAKAEVERVRAQLQRVLSDTPDEEDAPLYNTMKLAEEAIIKEAGIFNILTSPFETATRAIDHVGAKTSPLLGILGAGLTLGGYGAYRQASGEAKSKSKLRALQRLMELRKTETPRIRMVPTLSRNALLAQVDKEREEKERKSLLMLPAGSPAQQAQGNDVLVGV